MIVSMTGLRHQRYSTYKYIVLYSPVILPRRLSFGRARNLSPLHKLSSHGICVGQFHDSYI